MEHQQNTQFVISSKPGCCERLLPSGPLYFPDESPYLPEHRRRPPRIRSDGTISIQTIPPSVSYQYGCSWRRFRIYTPERLAKTLICFTILLTLLVTLSVLSFTTFIEIEKSRLKADFVPSEGTLIGIQCQSNRRLMGTTQYNLIFQVTFQPSSNDVAPAFKNVELTGEYSTSSYQTSIECELIRNTTLSQLREIYPPPSPVIIKGFYSESCVFSITSRFTTCFTNKKPDAGWPIWPIIFGYDFAIIAGILFLFAFVELRRLYSKKPKSPIEIAETSAVFVPSNMIRYDAPVKWRCDIPLLHCR